MKLDFWNNPIVVSSLRIRYRRGGLMTLMTSYFLVLDAAGAILFYYRERVPGPFPRNFMLGIMGFQFMLSFMIASSATSQSIRNEVVNRTLDFQRIATLSPFQILLGKLLGESTLAFFSILPTIPVAVYCCLILGVEGLNLPNLLLLYLTLITTTILSGASGLLQPLETDPNGKTKPAGNPGAIIFGLFFCFVPPLIGANVSILSKPWAAALLGLFTPIPTFLGIHGENLWQHGMHFFALQIPFLLLTPISQLFISGLIVHAMVRRLVNPSRTAVGRTIAYGLMVLVDLLVAGVFYDHAPPLGLGLFTRSAVFWLVHLVFSIFLMNLITPNRDTLWSWSWRFRGQGARLHDLTVGERSVNSAVLVIFALLGLVDYFGMLLWPATQLFAAAEIEQFLPDAVRMALTCTILFLAAGSLFQWLMIAFDRSGRSLFFTVSVMLIVPVDLVGRYFQLDYLVSLSPSGHFSHWLTEQPSNDLFAMLASYSLLLIVCQYWTHRRIAAMNRVVDEKLRQMHVSEEPALGGSGVA